MTARQKGLYARKRRSGMKSAEKSMEDGGRREDRPDRPRTHPTPCSPPDREPGPRPEGRHRDQDVIHLLAQSHGRSFWTSGQTPWLHSVASKPSALRSDRHGHLFPVDWFLPSECNGGFAAGHCISRRISRRITSRGIICLEVCCCLSLLSASDGRKYASEGRKKCT